ncbi:MAG: ASPIC/UnbV domain-containing protein, partial [Planctomycetes bacterium]|nr:ASPIC/UnbV domain-containing protein [Planctomycetota bacterium]
SLVYYPAGPSGDYDNDGKVDLFLINWFQGNHSRLLKNESGNGHWLDVRIVGSKVNRMGLGSQIRIYKPNKRGAGALLGFQEMTIGYGYASGQPAICHFGLADQTLVDVEIRLPNGKKISLKGLETNQRVVAKEL